MTPTGRTIHLRLNNISLGSIITKLNKKVISCTENFFFFFFARELNPIPSLHRERKRGPQAPGALQSTAERPRSMQWRRSATWLAPCLVAVLAAVSLSGLGHSPRHAGKRHHLDVLKKTEVDLSAALEAAGWADGPLSPMVSGSNDGDGEFPPALAPAPATLIPKVIHFTWKHSDLDELPEHFLAFQNKWRKLNPNWLVVVWSDEDMVNIVSR